MRQIRTIEESNARIRQLRAQGYRVKRIRLPDGSLVVLKSKRPFVCSGSHHCTQRKKPKR